MAIITSTYNQRPVNDGFHQQLLETNNYFQDQGVSIMGDWGDVLSNSPLYEDYVDHMVVGLDADSEANFRMLAENSRMDILNEAMSTNISPVTSLTLPALRKTWPRLALPNAMPTEAIDKPKFTIMYRTPYFKTASGQEIDIISDFTQASDLYAERTRVNDKYWTLPQASGADLFSTSGASTAVAAGLAGVGTSIGDSIDVDVWLESAVITVGATAGSGGTDYTVSPTTTVAGLTSLPKIDTRTDMLTAVVTSPDGLHTDTVFLQFDRKAGTFTGSSLKGQAGVDFVKSVKIKGFVSTEMNNRIEEILFKITQKEITIPTSQHLAAQLPMEYLTDLLRMFNMDGVSIVVNDMSSFIAQKIDIEGLKFLEGELDLQNGRFERTFDVHPYSHYTGSPTEWKSEIRTIIDNLCADMFNNNRFDGGYFVLVCNPIDAMLLNNVEWSFDNTMQEVSGVKVTYSAGFYTGAFKYQVVSSTNVTRGSITVFFVPTSSQDQKTYMFFPYSLSIAPTASTGQNF
jgi:hypothetical protein